MKGHGKVILLGEHSVVYGRPALAAALASGAEAVAAPAERALLKVTPWSVCVDAEGEGGPHQSLREAFRALLDGYGLRPNVRVDARVSLPGSAGLGASAALSVAVVRAIDAELGVTRSDAEVAERALAAERVFHGNPSGIDTAMAACGGLGLYRKGEGVKPLACARPLVLVVGHSGEPGSTKETVASVARQHAQNPGKLEQIFDAIESVVVNGKSAIERGELSQLGQLMVLNQKLLTTMLLSTTRLEEMCAAAMKAGALGAKLTGGGGGGCMIALCESRAAAEPVRAAIAALGREVFVTEAG